METRADGTMLIRSTAELPEIGGTLTDSLAYWATHAPERTFLAERDTAGGWQHLTYRDAAEKVARLATALLAFDLAPERPLAILSGNDIEHALMALAAMRIGVPYCPVSPPYSLVAKDFAKLRYVMGLLTPGLVFVSDGAAYSAALAAAAPDLPCVATRNAEAAGAVPLATLLATEPSPRIEAAQAQVGPETIAKFLLTSGSTGEPKAVINTQGMLMVNQAMLRHCIPFLAEEPPVLVDWLPWNHTFGSNHNFGIVLVNGGTLHIDAGKPMPGAIAATVANLREIAPTSYFNVPKGFEALLPHLEADEAFARHFFSRLRMLFYAGAGLSPVTWDGYQRLAKRITGQPIPFVTGLGATETAPSALMNLMPVEAPGNMGHPMAGVTMKLVPNGEKLEIRVKAASVTPGYWRSPDLTAKAFDEEGFYCFGDAVTFAVPGDPAGGFIFNGRIAEDFKLATGTWVSVGPLRAAFLAAFAPLAKDVVITGHDRDDAGAMIFPDLDACRALAAGASTTADILAHPAVHQAFSERLKAFAKAATGSSNRIVRVLLLEDLPSIDRGEITDKGSINQRAVLRHRAGEVEVLYREPPSARTIGL
jgi:feruloyl-CoA synthase